MLFHCPIIFLFKAFLHQLNRFNYSNCLFLVVKDSATFHQKTGSHRRLQTVCDRWAMTSQDQSQGEAAPCLAGARSLQKEPGGRRLTIPALLTIRVFSGSGWILEAMAPLSATRNRQNLQAYVGIVETHEITEVVNSKYEMQYSYDLLNANF